jgi:hypothetical protein
MQLDLLDNVVSRMGSAGASWKANKFPISA